MEPKVRKFAKFQVFRKFHAKKAIALDDSLFRGLKEQFLKLKICFIRCGKAGIVLFNTIFALHREARLRIPRALSQQRGTERGTG